MLARVFRLSKSAVFTVIGLLRERVSFGVLTLDHSCQVLYCPSYVRGNTKQEYVGMTERTAVTNPEAPSDLLPLGPIATTIGFYF